MDDSKPRPTKKMLESFIARLLQGVNRSPLLKAFPTKTIKRIDLERFRIVSPDAPEQLVSGLLGSVGQVHLRFENFSASGKKGEESRELFSVLKTKLCREAQLIFRETGLRTLWLAYPTLYVPDPNSDKAEFLLAPLFLWPLRILSSGLKEGELLIGRDPDGGAPRFNRVAMQWIRRSLDFDPTEPSSADVRDAESVGHVKSLCQTVCESFRPPVDADLSGTIKAIPNRSVLFERSGPELFNSGLVGLIQWENQELIRDMELLSKMEDLQGAAADLLSNSERPTMTFPPAPKEVDRYLVTDTDISQESSIWKARDEKGVVVHGPPGTGKSQVIVNIIADCLAHGQRVLVICQKKAALDVVSSRLTAVGLGNLFLQVDDAEADRRRVIETLKNQERPQIRESERGRENLALKIEKLEQELETFRKALFDIRITHGISYREMLGRLAVLRRLILDAKPLAVVQKVLRSISYPEVKRLCDNFKHIEQVFKEADPIRNPWRNARQDITDDPYERKHIADELEILSGLAEKVDKWVKAPGPKGLTFVGDCKRIADAASQLQKGVRILKSSLLTPARYRLKVGSSNLSDSSMEKGAKAVSGILRWQYSFLRLFIPEYYRSSRMFSGFVKDNAWILRRDVSDLLKEIEQRAITLSVVLDHLTKLAQWLEKKFIDELCLRVRHAQALLPILRELVDYLDRLPAILRYRATVRGLTETEKQVLDGIITSDPIPLSHWPAIIELSMLLTWIGEAERVSPILQAMSEELYEVRKKELQSTLQKKRETEPQAILSVWGQEWQTTDLQWRKWGRMTLVDTKVEVKY